MCVTESAYPEALGCMTTAASGTYRFIGAWADTFKVAFSADSTEILDEGAISDPYPTQWWNGQPTFATATPIAVTPPAIISGIDAALGPPPAVVTPPPSVAPGWLRSRR